MKAPQIKSLEDSTASDPFTKKVMEVKKDAGKMEPRSYSLPQSAVSYINAKAAELSAIEGKPVSASTALRMLLEEHKAIK